MRRSYYVNGFHLANAPPQVRKQLWYLFNVQLHHDLINLNDGEVRIDVLIRQIVRPQAAR